jgi:hypothetical protein
MEIMRAAAESGVAFYILLLRDVVSNLMCASRAQRTHNLSRTPYFVAPLAIIIIAAIFNALF